MKHLEPEEYIFMYYIFSSALAALPDPEPKQTIYGFLFRFLHILGANLDKAQVGKKAQVGTTVVMPSQQAPGAIQQAGTVQEVSQVPSPAPAPTGSHPPA